MMAVKAFRRDETLTDNTMIKYCMQCSGCRFWGNSDAFSNKPEKSSCDKYPYPQSKPSFVINNEASCTFREPRK